MASTAEPKKPRRTTRKTSPATPASPIVQAAADFDRSQLGESVRVYALAKQLGVSSKDLIAALADLGEKKVAQSSLTRADAEKLLDSLAPAAPPARKAAKKTTKKTTRKATKKATKKAVDYGTSDENTDSPEPAPAASETPAPVEEDDELRERVRKNVDNEIHQIEEKVKADLTEGLPATDVAAEEAEPDETEAPESPESRDAESAAYAPLFVAPGAKSEAAEETDSSEETESAEQGVDKRGSRRTRRRVAQSRKKQSAPEPEPQPEEPAEPGAEETPQVDEPVAIKGSTRLEAQRRRRTEMRESGRTKKHIVSQAEFLARRESVERTMVVRERPRHDGGGTLTQVGVLEDDLLVEHFVTTESQASMIGNIYLGRVQNVLPSMEAAFIDIGTGRNGVLYSSEVDWKTAGLGGRGRRIEQALRSGDQILVQVSKDPLGHKGPRLTTQISLPGRFLVYVPGGRSAGISRKLPAPERKRLKDILGRVIPGKGGAIIRTAAENVPEEAIAADVRRLHNLWEDVQERADKEKQSKGATPVTLYEEPDMLVKVVRDLFNEDFASLVIDGKRSWSTVHSYVKSVAPDLADRLVKYDRRDHDGQDAFEHFRVDEQIHKALGRKVWLPSGGYLIIDRTEAMIVIDVNTGKFTGAGGNLEETVTRNNLEAAEEIVRQIRLRDLGGMIVVDFIDMVLPENQDLVLRRLKEALGRDHTRHQVSEVTSLGLVQMTRKRIGTGLVETFTTECHHCEGTGLIFHEDPVDRDEHHAPAEHTSPAERPSRDSRQEKDGDSEDVLERMADSVLKLGDPEETSDATEQDDRDDRDEESGEKRTSKRRGRRGGGRGRGSRGRDTSAEQQEQAQPQEQEAEPVSEWERIAAEAVETARELDPDEPSDADYVAETGEKSFAEALEEFESSPRRRRKTRGNSRSDRRPERGETDTDNRAEKSPRRRRATATTATTDTAEAPAESVQAEAQEQKRAEVSRKTPDAPARDEQPTRSSRGRRRAVRRRAAAGREDIRQEVKEPVRTDVEKRPEPESGSSRGSRGRRRATRRSSSRR